MSGDRSAAAAAADVSRRWTAVTERLAAACRRADRDPAAITLVGAGKRQPIERLAAACAAGLTVLGENRVDEAERHREALAGAQPDGHAAPAWHLPAWHLIGPLQSNKARRAAQLFDVIHSVDRLKIARRLDNHLGELGRSIPAFVEVNLGGEASKHGFAPEGLAGTIRPLADLEHLRVGGLMAIPPPAGGPEGARPWFRRLRELRDELAARPEWSSPWSSGSGGALSMGMSQDFEVAVEEGATHVRVGSDLFGPRPA